MVDALSDPITDHFGRQLLHWLVGYSSSWYLSLSGSEFIDNFKKLESGASILEQGLGVKLDEEDEETNANASHRAGTRSDRSNGPSRVNQERAWRFIRRDDPIVEYGQRNYENLMLVDIMENCEEGVPVEMFNVLAPFHQNSGAAAAAAAAATGGASTPGNQNGPAGGRGVENMQVTQPCSAPSSPTITSPGALSSTSFCLPTGVNSTSSGGSSVITSTTAADTGDPNWQATKSTVRERNAAMFNNDLMADIRFIVGTDEQVQTIPAHKYVLATGSSVFYAMFYGGLAENKQEIKVPDVEPNAFLTLLKYLYCDEIHLEADNVLATLYVAKKYIVPHLARACVNYLETSLTAKNACLLLSQSRLFEEPELMQRCWEVIDAQVCDSTANLEVIDRETTHFITDSCSTGTSKSTDTVATSPKSKANTSSMLNSPNSPPLCSPSSCFEQPESCRHSISPGTSNVTGSSSSISSSATVSSSVSTSSLSTSELDNSGEPSV